MVILNLTVLDNTFKFIYDITLRLQELDLTQKVWSNHIISMSHLLPVTIP